jgi:hypothetical protein
MTERERARKWRFSHNHFDCRRYNGDELDVMLAVYATDRVRQSLELACKAVCPDCADGVPLTSKWHCNCAAAPIRKLMEGGWDD